jgi:hypothetical protein
MNILIEEKPFSVTEYFAGKYEGHDFTVVIINDEDNGWSHVSEITWIEDRPIDTDFAEDYITKNFYSLVNRQI